MSDASIDGLVSEVSETFLKGWVKKYQQEHFPNLATSELQILVPDRGPACYLMDKHSILIHPAVAPFTKLCRILILHELIHADLYKATGDPDALEGEAFQAKKKELLEAGVFADLL